MDQRFARHNKDAEADIFAQVLWHLGNEPVKGLTMLI